MKKASNIYICPTSKKALELKIEVEKNGEIISGSLSSGSHSYKIQDGVPIFIDQNELPPEQASAMNYYNDVAKVYDEVAELTFRTQRLDEIETRKKFIKPLALSKDSRVLEIACGTGRDSVNIANELGENGKLYLQDISSQMLARCRNKLEKSKVPTEFLVADACNLPFPDNYFDAIFSFGGICVFGDITKSLKEMIRVSKDGAKIAVGDESLAPWLYDTEYGKIMLNTNPLLKAELPLKHLPREARDVRVQWVIGGAYFIIDFSKGTGEPPADFDIEIPGDRGGTLRTRYYGKLEGVTPDTWKMMENARLKSGKSRHQWLEQVIRKAASSEEKA